MVPEENYQVLKIIVDRLKNINWILIGSTNLAVQGVNIKANDIDILTTKEGAYKIEEALHEFCIEPVHYKESTKFNSHYGLFIINGIEIEVMGDIENFRPKGELWGEKSNFKKHYIEFHEITIPCAKLEQEYYAYIKMGRFEKAELIKTRLDNPILINETLPKKYSEILFLLSKKLKNIDWFLIGSNALILQGLNLQPNDIDILTTKEGIQEINNIFSEYITKSLTFSEDANFSSYKLELNIDGIIIEIIGNPINKLPGKNMWGENKKIKKIIINHNNFEIPCVPLAQHYNAYIMLGRFEKAEKIKKVLEKVKMTKRV